jgi:type IV pilus assembly protein PilA
MLGLKEPRPAADSREVSFSRHHREPCPDIHVRSDEGFSMVELLVVLFVIGILIAIAIPTFLGTTKTANNTAVQSNLQTALVGTKVYYRGNDQSYAGLTKLSDTATSPIQQVDTGLSYISGGSSSSAHFISTNTSAGNWVNLAAWSPGTRDCWGILDVTSNQTTAPEGLPGATAAGTYFWVLTNVTSSANCSATVSLAGATDSTTGFPSS